MADSTDLIAIAERFPHLKDEEQDDLQVLIVAFSGELTKSVHSLSRGRLDWSEIADVVITSFDKGWRRRASFAPPPDRPKDAALKAWLRAIAANVARDVLRTKRSFAVFDEALWFEEPRAEAEGPPSDRLKAKLRFINGLSPRDRRIAEAASDPDRGWQRRVAMELGMSDEAVKTAWFRIRARGRQAVEREEFGETS